MLKKTGAALGAVLGGMAFAVPFTVQAIVPPGVHPEHARTASVTVWDDGFATKRSFETFERMHLQGATIASGDVDGDKTEELIVAAGPGRAPEIRIYESDGKEIGRFLAFAPSFKGGVRVAAGDLDNDGTAEIVAAPGPGMKPSVAVFNARGDRKLAPADALAYVKTFTGGVRVAVGDFDRNGVMDIATAPGPGGGPHVRLFNGRMEAEAGMDFFAYDASMREGVTLAAIRTPWGDQLVTGVESWAEPLIRRYSFDANGARLDKEFHAFATSSRSGLVLGAFDVDRDGTEEILAAGNGGTIPEVKFFDLWGTAYGKYLLKDPPYRGALSFADLDADGDGAKELASASILPTIVGPTEAEKAIHVDLNEQRLYAYEHGRIAKMFLVSSGVPKYATPEFDTTVMTKQPVKRYAWSYGPGHPDNYNLPNVKWNLQIAAHHYIHSAYWHNNFGNRMSHGCINMSIPDAKWVYDWAEVGMPVQTAYGKTSVQIASK